MQKRRDSTAALEHRMSNVEDQMVPLQRAMHHVQSLTSGHVARLEDMENRLRCINIQAMGIPEMTEGRNLVAFIEN